MTKPEKTKYRLTRARIFVTGLALSAIAACGSGKPGAVIDGSQEAREVASEFIAQYYIANDVASASRMAMEPLKSQLEATGADIRQSGAPKPAENKPEVHADIIHTDVVSADEVVISWSMTTDTGVDLVADTVVKKAGADWSVSELHEQPK
ncbi:MAG: hypothetical protein KJ871_06000 [Alphaproteobacteria bacterium]|nr:hypothetical protein [Alphaproteobacteria bacterium]MBU2082794.1 hypothetical protein [Alphaproteobacteria bacterium]MBU2143083.1 hypothetical protein [Alphaproteobacteria bacterium]MBU2196501.1 hypothetical protein [Alphaproteobacteria bacterium]